MTKVKSVVKSLLLFGLILLMVWVGIFSTPTKKYSASAETSSKALFEQTNVMDDLKKSTIDGEAFDLTKYSFDSKKNMQIISFVEYCYSYSPERQDNYGLYAYVYNPKGLKIDTFSPLNTIQFAVGLGNSNSYYKYRLAYLNASTDADYEGLFYKFRVELPEDKKKMILDTVNSTERVYRLSGIEILTSGDMNATEYNISAVYKYSGYAKGYGSNENAESTLRCINEKSESLTLQVHPTQFRPGGNNGKNEFTQDSLHSVYFAVPNEFINLYGDMTAVHATWLDAVIKPQLVTGNASAYNAIVPNLGKSIKSLSTFPYMYLGAYSTFDDPEGGQFYLGGYMYYNPEPLFRNDDVISDQYGDDIATLYGLYYSGDGADSADSYVVSSEMLMNTLNASASKYGGSLINGKYASCMFESVDSQWTDVNIKADQSYTLTDQVINKSWWDKLWGLSGDITTNKFDGIKAIYQVKDSDLSGDAATVSRRLFIGEQDFTRFAQFYNAHKSSHKVYLFRYQVSDYVAQEASLLQENTSIFGDSFKYVDSNAYFFKETINLDFDIIDVTFSSGEVDTVIPVVSNPIDVVPDVTPPIVTTPDKKDEPSWLDTLKRILIVLISVVLLIVLWPIVKVLLTFIVKAIAWVIKKIGELLSLPFRKRNKKEDKKNSNDKNE